MSLERNQAAIDRIGRTVGERAAKRIETAAKAIAGTRFTVSREGTTVLSRDRESLVAEYGDGVAPSAPWANEAIKEGLNDSHP